MALTLVLGPANSAKAGEVLGAYAAAAPRGGVLVVPTQADAEHYARELAGERALLGSVLTFGGLAGEMARRAGLAPAALGAHQRELLLARAIADVPLVQLAQAASSPGFARALGALIAELQRALIAPPRFAAALRTWAAEDERRAAYGRELAGLYFAYRRRLERAGRVDGDLLAWQALDALRAAPARWGAREVFFYGFDDLHALQRDAVETLAGRCQAPVTVSLNYEGGRAAFAARAETVEELRALAERVVVLEAREDFYAPEARGALHNLERGLFEPGAGRTRAGRAIALLEAGGERAEAELLAAEVLELREAGVPAEEIAVVLRSPERAAGALRRVLAQYGLEVAGERSLPLGHTALGRGLLALARCWLLEPRTVPAGEILEYLRAPGVLASAEGADALEAHVRRRGLLTLAELETGPRPEDDSAATALAAGLEAVALLAAGEHSPPDALAAAARRLLAGLGPGRAQPLVAEEARACAAVLAALAELAELGEELTGGELLQALERLPVAVGEPARPGAVLISDPLRIRARRFRAVLVAGLQEGEFPLAGIPEPFLSDERRRELAATSGLRLRPREDALARERYLFYATVSRATERLVLSFRSSDEEGNLALPSPFLRDVAELLEEQWWERRRRRLLADVVWEPEQAPTAYERRRALAAAAPAVAGAPVHRLSPVALAHVRHRELVSAGALEAFGSCPVNWLLERQLAPEPLAPESEPMARGSFMHDVLERVLGGLGEAVTPASLPRALVLLEEATTQLPAPLAAGRPPGVRAAALRGIRADLRRYLEHEASTGGDWRPFALEQRFGFESEDSLPPLELGSPAEPLRVRGVIDRIDVDASGTRAIVRDYKSGSVRDDYRRANWAGENRLQVALYMLAVRELLGLEPVAGLYQPLRGADLRARGAHLREGGAAGRLFPGDGCEPDELEELLGDARARALALAARLRSGELTPCPSTCSRDGCRHPEICRTA